MRVEGERRDDNEERVEYVPSGVARRYAAYSVCALLKGRLRLGVWPA